MELTPGPDDALHVYLAPPAFAVITATQIVLFDGGDAGRVLWHAPEPAPPKT